MERHSFVSCLPFVIPTTLTEFPSSAESLLGGRSEGATNPTAASSPLFHFCIESTSEGTLFFRGASDPSMAPLDLAIVHQSKDPPPEAAGTTTTTPGSASKRLWVRTPGSSPAAFVSHNQEASQPSQSACMLCRIDNDRVFVLDVCQLESIEYEPSCCGGKPASIVLGAHGVWWRIFSLDATDAVVEAVHGELTRLCSMDASAWNVGLKSVLEEANVLPESLCSSEEDAPQAQTTTGESDTSVSPNGKSRLSRRQRSYTEFLDATTAAPKSTEQMNQAVHALVHSYAASRDREEACSYWQEKIDRSHDLIHDLVPRLVKNSGGDHNVGELLEALEQHRFSVHEQAKLGLVPSRG